VKKKGLTIESEFDTVSRCSRCIQLDVRALILHLGAGSKDGLPARLHYDVRHVTNLCARTRVSNCLVGGLVCERWETSLRYGA